MTRGTGRTNRGAGRWTAALVVVVVVFTAACGDDAPELKTDDPPEDIIAFGIDELGPERSVLPPEESRRLVILSLGSQGVPVAEAECVLSTGLPFVGGEAGFAELTISQVARFQRTAKRLAPTDAEKATIDACVSAESTARGEKQELAPDMDLEGARELGAMGAVLNAEEMGLEPDEAECYAQKAFREVELDTIRGLLVGELGRDDRDPGAAIEECLTDERIGEMAKVLEDALLADKAKQAEEQQQLQDEINRQMEATTTTAGG